MSKNEFDCLSNAVLQAGLRSELAVAFAVPERVREMLEGIDVGKVLAVTIHQCPQKKGTVVDYRLEVHIRDGERKTETFQASGFNVEHDDYVLYDFGRDGVMKHLHLLH